MSYKTNRRCAWVACSKVFEANTTGLYCSPGCKKASHSEMVYQASGQSPVAGIVALRAENARLREALHKALAYLEAEGYVKTVAELRDWQ